MQEKYYAAHFTFNNRMDWCMTPQMVERIKKYKGMVLESGVNPDGCPYLATLLFNTLHRRDAFVRECNACGVECIPEERIAYVERRN